jgi:hypothetical protein
MQKDLTSWLVSFAAVVAFSVCAVAQHGAGGAGAGRPAGVGPSSAGSPSGVGPGNSGRTGDMGSTGMGHASLGSHSPNAVLDNSKLNTSLTNALEKSGVSVPGGDLKTACSGFKNLGQCVAAMHVAKNLNLSFSDFQSKMTGSSPESLGKAIHDLGGPNVNAKSEAKKANKQANQDLNAAEAAS